MTEHIPENADETQPPDSLQTTSYTCGHCKSDDFSSFDELAAHVAACEDAPENEG